MKPEDIKIISTKEGPALWIQPPGREISGHYVAWGEEDVDATVDAIQAAWTDYKTQRPAEQWCTECGKKYSVDDFVKIQHLKTCKTCRERKRKGE